MSAQGSSEVHRVAKAPDHVLLPALTSLISFEITPWISGVLAVFGWVGHPDYGCAAFTGCCATVAIGNLSVDIHNGAIQLVSIRVAPCTKASCNSCVTRDAVNTTSGTMIRSFSGLGCTPA